MCGTDVNFATLVYIFSPGLDLFETTKKVWTSAAVAALHTGSSHKINYI